jgi:chromosome segregation ATPase
MSDDGHDGDGLLGLTVERAAEQVAPTVDDDQETVRTTIQMISDDGVVTQAAVQDALGRVSKVVATPETRIELADDALTAARDAATPVADTDLVATKLATFEADLSALEERVDALGSQLSDLVDRAGESGDLYTVARSIRELRAEATDAQNAADALSDEIKTFRRKVANPTEWVSELREDVDTLEASLEDLQTAVDRLHAIDTDAPEDGDPALAWADTTLQYRVRELFVEDVRAELDVLETLGAETGVDLPLDTIRSRLRELEDLQTDISAGLDDAFDPAWDQQYSDTVASFDETIASFEPPVPWATLQDKLQRHREQLQQQA